MAPHKFRRLDGVFLLNKPSGISSNNVLQKVRWLFHAEKAGHTGTLDPNATGLLPICFGEATKFGYFLLDSEKTYRAVVRLGQTTATGDSEGEIISEHPVAVELSDVENVLSGFRGEIEQIPPMHSALKHQGRPLYDYIRKGETLERRPRRVFISELRLDSLSGYELGLTVRCSKGTYIRVLAEDIGKALGCGAHLKGLCRTTVAHFDLKNSYALENVASMTDEQRDACVLAVESLMPAMPKLHLDDEVIRRLAQGQRLALSSRAPEGKVGLFGPSGFVGVGLVKDQCLAPDRLTSDVAIQAAKASLVENIGVEQVIG